jgi:hypothetical protein
MTFEAWLINLGKSSKTAHNYSAAIQGSISKWALEEKLIDKKIDASISLRQFESLTEKIRLLDKFIERNTVGKGMYGAALKHYAYYLDDLTGASVQTDVEGILADTSMDITEKSTLVNARIGQGVFRKNLINYWNGCAVTGYRNTRLLIASHVKPWSAANNEERLDTNNGILLLPNLDKAFDLGYITFELNGHIRISKGLDKKDILGINSEMTINLKEQHIPYIEYHQKIVFEKFIH